MTFIRLTFFLLLILPVSQARARGGMEPILGIWSVYRNDLDPAEVQAYVENDPSVIGAKIVFRKEKIYWIARGDFNETCRHPRYKLRHKKAFDILCDGNRVFGPDVTDPNFVLSSNGQLIIRWYDGLVMHLKRSR
jgi:hypothetical protein